MSPEKQLEARLAAQAEEQERLDAEVLNSLQLPKVSSKKTELLGKQVRAGFKSDMTTPVHVLRSWLAEGESREVQ